jgi:DNA-binding protein H-NS
MIDLQKLDFAQLKELGQQVAKQIAVAAQRDVERAGQQIRELAKSLDMSVPELLEQTGLLNQKPKKTKGAASSGVKGKALYQNPEDASQTWTGRGRQPGWIAKFQEAGGNLDQLKIKE